MKYKVTLNGRTYEVEVEAGKAMLLDEYEAIAPAPTAAPVAAPVAAAPVAAPAAASTAPAAMKLAGGEPVKAPMPGIVLQVQQGQVVKEGDVLVILEAMKMENEVVAPRAGTVVQVVAARGSSVESGAPLVVLG